MGEEDRDPCLGPTDNFFSPEEEYSTVLCLLEQEELSEGRL